MDQPYQYDLAFVAPKRRPRTVPEIVFIIDERHLSLVVERLHFLNMEYRDYINAYLSYLGEEQTDLSLPIPDLFGRKEFGFAKCGYWGLEDDKVHFCFQLRPDPWTHFCSLTIFLLTKALDWPFANEPMSNQRQSVSLVTHARFHDSGYGHAVGGWISEDVLNWLKSYAGGNLRSVGIIKNAAPMHPGVIRALQAAAGAMISSPRCGYRASTREIYGWVRDSGAFTMNCSGNACDLSVYPDQDLRTGCKTAEFGCHNLDNADQQLTLLAGLAKICQLTRECS